ncbi:MAG: NAD(P)H-dependent oxidoreductase subunit E, partial [Ruminococcus sp.]|nr:NAD(P)H-dependent oxidoreductase subunit E [Ruminococcus sp.]
MTFEELTRIRKEKSDLIKVRKLVALEAEKLAANTAYRKQVLVCGGTGCTSSGSKKIIEALENELKAQGLDKEVLVVRTGCFGLCSLGPIVIVYPEGTFYAQATPEGIVRIVDEHLKKGEVCKDLLYKETVHEDGSIISLSETNFYKKQLRIALRNCGVIDPENIEEYIGTRGYEALYKVLDSMTPDEVVKEVLDSGLRGRGGAGFPTGRKWMFTKDAPGDVKYVACNADEGDPGAFMDRSILEGDPHAIIEAMTIASYAVGAHQGYVYVRA